MEVIKKATPTAPKLLLYGMAGVGKSSLAAKLEKPLFIDLEGGLNYLDVDRTETLTTYDKFYEILVEIGRNREQYKEYKTIVIDSVDWLVRLATEKAAGIDLNNLDATLNRAGGGYGNGKQMLENEIRTHLLPFLSRLNLLGFGICFIAHTEQKVLLDGDGNKIETITPKIDVNTMNVFVEWCDFVYYLKKRDNGGRYLLLDSDGVSLAKNRVGRTGEVNLNDNDINELLKPKKEKK